MNKILFPLATIASAVLISACGSSSSSIGDIESNGQGSVNLPGNNDKDPIGVQGGTDGTAKVSELSAADAEFIVEWILDDLESPLEAPQFSPSNTPTTSVSCTNGGNATASPSAITFSECQLDINGDTITSDGTLRFDLIATEGEGTALASGASLTNQSNDAYFSQTIFYESLTMNVDGQEAELNGAVTQSHRLKARNKGEEATFLYKDHSISTDLFGSAADIRTDLTITHKRSYNPSFSEGYIELAVDGDGAAELAGLRYEYTMKTETAFRLEDGTYEGLAEITVGQSTVYIEHMDYTTFTLSLDTNSNGTIDHSDTFTLQLQNNSVSVNF